MVTNTHENSDQSLGPGTVCQLHYYPFTHGTPWHISQIIERIFGVFTPEFPIGIRFKLLGQHHR